MPQPSRGLRGLPPPTSGCEPFSLRTIPVKNNSPSSVFSHAHFSTLFLWSGQRPTHLGPAGHMQPAASDLRLLELRKGFPFLKGGERKANPSDRNDVWPANPQIFTSSFQKSLLPCSRLPVCHARDFLCGQITRGTTGLK